MDFLASRFLPAPQIKQGFKAFQLPVSEKKTLAGKFTHSIREQPFRIRSILSGGQKEPVVLAFLRFLSYWSCVRFHFCRYGKNFRRAFRKWTFTFASNGGLSDCAISYRFLLHFYWGGASSGRTFIIDSTDSNPGSTPLLADYHQYGSFLLRFGLRDLLYHHL